jgi:hypothetical protein
MDDAHPSRDVSTIRQGPFRTCVSIVVYTVAGAIFAYVALQVLAVVVDALARD